MLGVEKSSLGPEVPTRLFRMLISEYLTLREIGVKPIIVVTPFAPSIAAYVEFLVTAKLASREGDTVTIIPRGAELLKVKPCSWSPAVVSFDAEGLGW
jgi:hypothetical protein